ncbi:MAG: LLM class flavin-dependent oxidoreductase [Acidimicrobiaceae bacterium]|nr:LLM class flavin-dependent oxidoreductase [Acidimicrobiaceae bacterium]MDE0516555.1 LLM class flavin-dependent oxidoreductase [Acidimicrobiaceae bacterium]MDE0655029.1 LLM class flavin-dependent oxidoreductase [Acidimicrobiaceae bacterium]
MTVTLEAEISPGMSSEDFVELAVRCEQAGFDRFGVSDVVFWPDCFVLQALVAQATSRIRIGSMVTNPYSRHPAMLAGAVATLQELSGGRMFLGIGVGAGLEDLRIDYPRPVRALREAITGIRGLLAGETVQLDGEMFPIDAARLVRPPAAPVPISVGTRSPQVMRLAGELADIALVGARHFTPQIARQYYGWLAEGATRAGRDVADIDIAPRLTLCVSSDGDLARRSVVRYVAHYLAIIRPSEIDPDRLAAIDEALTRATGWYFDLDRYDPPELFDLVTEDWIRRYAIAGAPSEIPAQVKAVTDLGFTSASLNLAAVLRPSAAQGYAETIDGFASVIDDCR